MIGAARVQPRDANFLLDCGSIVDQLTKGLQSGLDTASALAASQVLEQHVLGSERHLVALSVLVSNLRHCISKDGA